MCVWRCVPAITVALSLSLPPGFVSSSADILTGYTHCAVQENRLFRCLICSALSCVPPDWLCRGGLLYSKATEQFPLEDKLSYSFPFDGVVASYDAEMDKLVPVEVSRPCPSSPCVSVC